MRLLREAQREDPPDGKGDDHTSARAQRSRGKVQGADEPALAEERVRDLAKGDDPVWRVDGKQMEQLKRRWRMTEKRAQTKAERQLQADFGEDGVDSGDDNGDGEVAVAAPVAEGKPLHSLRLEMRFCPCKV